MKRSLIFIVVVPLLLLSSNAAAEITELVMPGPLVEGHARFESKCTLCHKLFDREFQSKLCLDCHKQVAADITAKQGFHGRNRAVSAAECRDCHTDHTGRDADIILLDVEIFDHRDTDFELAGAHRNVQCSKCHNPELIKAEVLNQPEVKPTELRKHRNAPTRCIDCHKATDPHQGHLGENCQDCHKSERWTTNSFSHDKTRFKLEGAHQKVACSLCHPQQTWKQIPNDCYSCHRLNDGHAGRYGNKCETCHTPLGKQQNASGEKQSPWKTVNFNHDKTRFPLRDKHGKVRCDLCHPQALYNQNLKTDCVSCHRTNDLHRGSYGDKCESCHNVNGWKQAKFDHDKTKFPLRDKHTDVFCNKCHTGPAAGKKLPLNCYGCHKHDDAHRSQLGEACDQCHNQRGWQTDIKFDHDLTNFPLIGMHAVAPCEGCHIGTTFKETRHECLACHQQSDAHKQRLSDKCADCHNPNGWGLWQFDHNTRTKFRLDGAHEGLDCLACHREPVKDRFRTGKTCESCHGKNDIHRGTFGSDCDRCHQTGSFRQIRIVQ